MFRFSVLLLALCAVSFAEDPVTYVNARSSSHYIRFQPNGNTAFMNAKEVAYAGGQPMRFELGQLVPWPLTAEITVSATWLVGWTTGTCSLPVMVDVESATATEIQLAWKIPAYVAYDCTSSGTNTLRRRYVLK